MAAQTAERSTVFLTPNMEPELPYMDSELPYMEPEIDLLDSGRGEGMITAIS